MASLAMVPEVVRAGLLVRRDALLAQLAELAPAMVAELTDVLLALEGTGTGVFDYAQMSNPFDAVSLFLERCGAWSEKRTICRSIMQGGFPGDPLRGTGYLLGVIDYSVEKGKLRRVHDLIGLPDWDPATQDGRGTP